ncbi:MAG: tetratricopeptide repeat protein [Anaerolineae bacterium]|nr:tetratricopeptide repeat protein [Anaerolineae bacterium]
MSNRKIAIAGWLVGLAVVVSPAFAQDQTGQQPDQPDATQGEMVSIVVGADLLTRAQASYNTGSYEKAIQDYSLFILLNPTFGEAYHLRGLAYAQLDDLDHALADMNESLDYPQASEQATGTIYSDRALIYLQQNNAEAALQDLNASIAAAPELPDAYFRRAQLYMFNEQYADALKDYDRLIELAPDFSMAHAGRAFANTRLGNADDAVADYDHLIELEPNNAGAYVERAILKFRQEQYEAALVDMNAAIRLQPDDPSLYLQRGIVNVALNHPSEAAADYLEWIRKQETRSVDANPLQPGESQVLPMQAGLSYAFPFEATTGQKVTLTVSARENSQTDPLIVLLDPNSQPILSDDDGGGNFDSAIEDFLIPSDGTYTLVVSHAGGGADGAVRVLLQVE